MSETNGDSFKDLFEREAKSTPTGTRLRVGETVEGVVSHVGQESVFVTLDGKTQGYFDIVDVAGPDGKPSLAVGDKVRAVIVELESRSGQIKLATKLGKEAGVEQLRAALESKLPVEGKIVGVNKGGVSVEVGGVRGFCPMSQLDDRFVNDASVFLNQTHQFVVTEIKGDREVVLSRRALLAQAASEGRKEALTRFAVGTRHTGRVSQLREFGAFVELERGIDGLVPLRELSHARGAKPEDIVQLGDVVEVEVIESKLETREKGGERIKLTLSFKRIAQDPWDGVDTIAPIGRVLAGRVVRLADFGAFVSLGSGIDGLLHLSEVSGKARTAADVLTVGQDVRVVAKSIDREKKRISLALADESSEVGATFAQKSVPVGGIVKAKVEKVETFGVFVQIEGINGRSGRGLIPNSELGVAQGVDLRKTFPEGREVTAKVLEGGAKIRLSIRAALADDERADFDSFKAKESSGAKMGTLGDLLAKKMKK
jgi:small subunit ribosomal protein S1